jgi:hypothetical protein
MAENHEAEAQETTIGSSVLPKSNAKPDIIQVITRKNSPESHVEYEPPKEETYEKQPTDVQATGQVTAGDSTDPSSIKQSTAGQTGGQAITNSSKNLLTSMSDEEFQKVKEEQKQKDEQEYQEWKGKLQQMQKSEQQSQEAQTETDQDEEYYQGYGQ